MRLNYLLILSTGLAGLFPIAPAGAEEADDPQVILEEIVVTARLREEAIRDVPFALTVLDNDTLNLRRIDDTHSLFRQVPGLSLTSFDDGRFAYFQLRGIGPLSQAISPDDGSVVTYIDGVPQPVYASEFAYLDLARIEVLRGPQGTLFGRNSQGGAINITTRPPGEAFAGRVRLEAGEDQYGLAEISFAGPVVADRLAATFAARLSTIDGFIDNVAPRGGKLGDRDTYAARGSLVLTPQGASGARFVLTGNVDNQKSAPFYYVLRGQSRDVVELNPENNVDRTAWGLSLKGDIPLGSLMLTSVTAINGFDNEQFTDDTDGLIYGPLFGGLPSAAFLPPLDFSDWREKERRLFQEIRLSGAGNQDVQWTAGAAYFRSDFNVELDNRSSFSPILNGDRDAEQLINSYAAFGEVTSPLGTPNLKGTFGLRFTRDEKELEATFTGVGFPGSVARFSESSKANFDLWTGRAALIWEATDDLNLYGTVGRGAKSGGFPRFTLNAAFGVASEAYAESTSWTYETGLKARILGGRGRVSVAGFYNDVTDEQLFVLDFITFTFVPVNLDTRSYGLELEGDVRLGEGWSVGGGLQWTAGEIRDADTKSGAVPGNDIPNVAPFSSTLTLSYEGNPRNVGTLRVLPSFTLTHQYVGERAADVAGSFDMPAYHNVDGRFGLRRGGVEAYLFGRNLFDEKQEINAVLYGPGVEGASLARGRIIGVGLTSAF